MHQLNVRNVDEALWDEVKQRAQRMHVPVGTLLNSILREWVHQHQAGLPADARERARRGMGIMKDLAPGVSLVDDVLEMRRLDREREERLYRGFAGDERS
jgi:predicted amidophosphoribosyltransferase